MNVHLRPMHESEIPLVRDSWTRSIDQHPHSYRDVNGRRRNTKINGRMRTEAGNNCPWMRVGGGDSMVTWAWHDAHREWVKTLWDGLDVIVAAHPANDEAIGWCASTPPGEHPLVVHYVWVIDLESARRHGVATTLLRAALRTADSRPVRFSWMNDAGRGLVSRTVERVTTMGDGASMH